MEQNVETQKSNFLIKIMGKRNISLRNHFAINTYCLKVHTYSQTSLLNNQIIKLTRVRREHTKNNE